MEAMIRVGAFDEFGETRTRSSGRRNISSGPIRRNAEPGQGWLSPPPGLEPLVPIPSQEPTRRERLEAETELLGFAVSGHPLELFPTSPGTPTAR